MDGLMMGKGDNYDRSVTEFDLRFMEAERDCLLSKATATMLEETSSSGGSAILMLEGGSSNTGGGTLDPCVAPSAILGALRDRVATRESVRDGEEEPFSSSDELLGDSLPLSETPPLDLFGPSSRSFPRPSIAR